MLWLYFGIVGTIFSPTACIQMKLLLDENLPEKIRFAFQSEHEIFTVRYMGWSGKQNGTLMALIAEHGFDGFITIDKNLPFQQNIQKYSVVIFVLDAEDNKTSTLLPYIEKLSTTLESMTNEGVVVITL